WGKSREKLYRRAADSSASRFIRRPSITAILGVAVFVTVTDGNQRCIVGDAMQCVQSHRVDGRQLPVGDEVAGDLLPGQRRCRAGESVVLTTIESGARGLNGQRAWRTGWPLGAGEECRGADCD